MCEACRMEQTGVSDGHSESDQRVVHTPRLRARLLALSRAARCENDKINASDEATLLRGGSIERITEREKERKARELGDSGREIRTMAGV